MFGEIFIGDELFVTLLAHKVSAVCVRQVVSTARILITAEERRTCNLSSDEKMQRYRKILKKIKRQTHYEKLFNRAIRKIRQFNGNLDGYKSDSCLPLNTGKTWISKEKRKRKGSIFRPVWTNEETLLRL